MGARLAIATPKSNATPQSSSEDTRFDRRFSEILDYATEVFADKGYEGASMRDLSHLSGMSLAGLYYYFDSKEKLLYLIQKHTFTTIVDRLRQRLGDSDDPEERIRIFVHNHVDYAVAKQKAMKVLSHEDDVLKDGHGMELGAIKREYYRICVELVDDLARAENLSRLGTKAASKVRSFHTGCCDGIVWDDELAVHVVQAKGGSQRRDHRAPDQRHLSARRARREGIALAARTDYCRRGSSRRRLAAHQDPQKANVTP